MSRARHDHEGHDAFAVLRALAAAGVPFVVVGGAAFGLLHPRILAHDGLADVDIVVPDTDAVRAVLRVLLPRGAEARVWGERVDVDVSADDLERALRGRYYVRLTGGPLPLPLDVTYEDAPFDVDDVIARAVVVDGVPVCPLRELWRGKRRKDPAAAAAFAARHGLVVPDDAVPGDRPPDDDGV